MKRETTVDERYSRKTPRWEKIFLLVAVVGALWGCKFQRVCAPGATQTCACPGTSARGAQSCAEFGEKWEPCDCNAGDTPEQADQTPPVADQPRPNLLKPRLGAVPPRETCEPCDVECLDAADRVARSDPAWATHLAQQVCNDNCYVGAAFLLRCHGYGLLLESQVPPR